MKRILAAVCMCAMLCLMMAACAPSPSTQEPEAQPTPQEESAMPKDQTYRLLFVGNSYTYYNDLWDLVTQAADSVGYSLEIDHVTQGGYYLDQYTNPADPFGAQLEAYLAENTYDAVFLQEQSTCPMQNYERFEAAVIALNDMVKENGAKTILYQTWGRRADSPTLSALRWTNQSMTEGLIKGYADAAKAIDAAVSPVGAAFYDVYTNHPEIELYDPDTTHPSLAGSYLAAMCHLATFTGVDPQTVTYDAGLDKTTVTVLQKAAYDAVKGN